jgi:hypothetical protein
MAGTEITKTLEDEVKEFVAEKWKNSECELCGADQWGFNPEPFSFVYMPVGRGEGVQGSYPLNSVVSLALQCTNCGNLRLITKGIFDKWLRERKLSR